jgi:catechol 2,3-dioxygenase-like lactoylglutathione lyase family enzyme
MTAPRLEHANLSVRDIDETITFLQTALPQLVVRADRRGPDGVRWVHIGTDDHYIAISDLPPRFNHLGFEVDDADAVRERLEAAGYTNTIVSTDHPARVRMYFDDAEGAEWEFVQYLSDDPATRNDYDLG